MHVTPYTELFTELQPNYDPRHIEAYVRLEHSTLDNLPRRTLVREAQIAALCIEEAGTEAAEACARSFGL